MAQEERLIFALDFDSIARCTPYLEALHTHVGCFKVGLELMNAVGTPSIVHHIQRLGGQVFVDGKFNDIPKTVGNSARAIAGLGVKMFNVHASAGRDAICAAADNKGGSLLLVVTVLTSMDDAIAQSIFGASINDKVLQFAHLAKEAGADGVICSPQELELLGQDESFKDFLKVTPGIRPTWAEAHDQKRTLSPTEAIKLGATHIVVGRPISNPPAGIGNPTQAAIQVCQEISLC